MSTVTNSVIKSSAQSDAILSSARRNNYTGIKFLVEKGVNPNHVNAVGQSALHIAALWGHVQSLKVLIDLKVKLNVQNKITGATPLHCTVQFIRAKFGTYLDCLRLLLSHGADVNILDFYGRKPIDYLPRHLDSYKQEYGKTMERLLQNPLPRVDIFEMIQQACFERVRKYMDKLSDIYETLEQHNNLTGFTPLLSALDQFLDLFNVDPPPYQRIIALAAILQLFLQKCANPNALLISTERNISQDTEIWSETKEVGIDSSLYRLCTMLSYVYNDNECNIKITYLEETITIFLSCNSKLYSETVSLLHDAARRDNIYMVRFLLTQMNINPNTKGRSGMTPLHFAARSGCFNIVKWLLNYKPLNQDYVDIKIIDDRRKTALDAAIINNKYDVIALLKNHPKILSK